MVLGIDIKDVMKVALRAGEQILNVYHSDNVQVEHKQDESPITLADKKSHEVILAGLKSLNEDIAVLSEESEYLPYQDRRSLDYLWVVDPLDGTKEFINRDGEFTVNIALIHRGRPVLGVIYAPVLDVLYYAENNIGSFKLERVRNSINSSETLSLKLPLVKGGSTVYVVASRSHMTSETEMYIHKVRGRYGQIEVKSAGSSLKLCLVAEENADVYPRLAPTMEWDTSAGQVIVEQSRANVVHAETAEPLVYNKENLLNPWFIAKRDGFEL